MIALLQQGGKFQVVFRKCDECKVVLDKGMQAAKIGLDVLHSANVSLFVRTVRAGLVEDHNKQCQPNERVEAGDRIVAVCGVTGDSKKMLEQLKESDKLELTVLRCR